MRIVAMVAVVAVLVAGGFWLARDRDPAQLATTTTPVEQATTSAASSTEARAEATPPAEADPDAQDTPEGADAPPVAEPTEPVDT
ncbi:MAG TPA: hypothetical protein VKZ43_07990, partial [Trueperaceae bacterium]|nr:hypothetical protein [Trueperaceae bacterium]